MFELDKIGFNINSSTALDQVMLWNEKTGTNCRRIKLYDVKWLITKN